MGAFVNDVELSAAEEQTMLDQALATLAWSEHVWCVPADPAPITGTVACLGHGTECDHLILAKDGFDLPETLDGIEYLEWSEESKAALKAQLLEFVEENRTDLAASGLDVEQVAHDFILTRNGHGAGFWDRGIYGDPVLTRLSDAAKAYGEANTSIPSAWQDDDGEIHARAVIDC